MSQNISSWADVNFIIYSCYMLSGDLLEIVMIVGSCFMLTDLLWEKTVLLADFSLL